MLWRLLDGRTAPQAKHIQLELPDQSLLSCCHDYSVCHDLGVQQMPCHMTHVLLMPSWLSRWHSKGTEAFQGGDCACRLAGWGPSGLMGGWGHLGEVKGDPEKWRVPVWLVLGILQRCSGAAVCLQWTPRACMHITFAPVWAIQ